jgi:hypothetical protein
VDYLKQHAVASAPALFVICRYLASRPDGASRDEMQRDMHPQALMPSRDGQSRDRAPAVLPASLDVGRDLGLLEAADGNWWTLPAAFRDEVQRVPAADSRGFRALLLQRLCGRAMAAIEAHESPPDVVRALTWLLQRDLKAPLPAAWNSDVQAAVYGAHLDPAVRNDEQWRPLVRWARALGLATVSDSRRAKSRLLVDPTRAIQDALSALPRRAPADDWFRSLRQILPILGERRLVAVLPEGAASGAAVPEATALAVQKLELTGWLRLVTADDAGSAVVLPLGGRTRRVGEVHIVDGAA